MSLPGIGAVVFDAVGTLLYPEPPAPVTYAMVGRRHGSRRTVTEIGARFGAAFAQQELLDQEGGWRTSEEREIERWRQIVALTLDDVADPESCFQELFQFFSWPQAWRCDVDAPGVIEQLAGRRMILGLASNYDRRLRRVVAGTPGLQRLDRLVISSEVGWRKPAPDFYAALCRTLGLAACEILCIGDDWRNDYQGARSAGLAAILFDPHRKRSADAVARITRLSELADRKALADLSAILP